MNYCIYLKKRKNKPYCKLQNEEIAFSRCRECVNKKYKNKTVINCHKIKTHKYSADFCTPLQSNNHQIRKSPLLKKKSPHKCGKMKNKSNKLAKLERSRFSVFTDNKDKCIFCPSTANLTWHEIFAGRNRKNSMADGFCLRMCLYCHEEKQENVEFNDFWHKKAQMYYEDNIGSREQFMSRYRRNYLD